MSLLPGLGQAEGGEDVLPVPEAPEVPVEQDDSSIIPSFLKGYRITVGPAVKQLDFSYTRPDSDEYVGTLTEGMYITYFISVGSPYIMIGDKWGVFFELQYSDFAMTKQDVGLEEVDLGTSVDGDYWLFAPTAVYVFGPVPRGELEFSLIAGVGLGIGYVNVQGDMILTEDGSNERLIVDENGLGIAANLLAELHYWNLMTRLSFGAAVLGDDYATYEIHNFTWEFGYKFTF